MLLSKTRGNRRILKIKWHKLGSVQIFTYLGCMLTKSAGVETDIIERNIADNKC
jgi:hypothetical protein